MGSSFDLPREASALLSLGGLGPWGLAPLGLAGLALVTRALADVLFRGQPLRMRVLGGITVLLAALTALLQLLAHAGWLRLGVLWACVSAAGVGVVLLARRRAPASATRRAWFEPSTVPLLAVAAAGLVLAAASAYLLPVWQWDSLGYHLPFVNFVLQAGGLRGLPQDVPYLATYPRNVELLFVAWRSLLPDDRLVDFAQLPLGVVGAGALAGCARELGARVPDALVAASAWLLVPAVFLQLPTNYIDVASAAYFLLASFFLLAAPAPAALACAGLAIGLFLGSKPSAPPAAALLALALLFRGFRARRFGHALGAVCVAGALGLEAYVGNALRHGNPVWPAIVNLGPLHLPGTISLDELLSSGAGAPRVHGSLPVRIWKSWTSLDALPAFDMRVGGMSLLFWSMLPGALYVALRRRPLLAALMVFACVTPDPAVARYVLPVPGLVLAAGGAWLGALPRAGRAALHLVLAGVAGANLAYAAPALTGEGPPLWAYLAMSWSERERAVGANGSPAPFIDARRRLGPGDVAVYDRSLWLPYLMWRSDLANRVVFTPDGWEQARARALLEDERVRLIAAGNPGPLSAVVMAYPERFRPLFRCKEPCVVYSH